MRTKFSLNMLLLEKHWVPYTGTFLQGHFFDKLKKNTRS